MNLSEELNQLCEVARKHRVKRFIVSGYNVEFEPEQPAQQIQEINSAPNLINTESMPSEDEMLLWSAGSHLDVGKKS